MDCQRIILSADELRNELNDIKYYVEKKRRDFIANSDKKLPIEEKVKEIETAVAYEVSIESDESGKKAYSNDTLRGVEIKKRLRGNPEYVMLKEKLDGLEKKERTLKTEIEILDKKLRISEQLINLLLIEERAISLLDKDKNKEEEMEGKRYERHD